MTNDFTAEAEQLTGVCRNIFGDESRWITADGYPHSLALSIIDSIYSTGSNYQPVINVVNEYRAYRRAQGGDADRDGTVELLATFKEAGGSGGWAELVNNRKPAHTKANAPLKAEVIRQAAEVLQNELGYTTREDLHDAYAKDEELTALKEAWLHLPSQRSGVTFNYLLILAGFQSVKPDRMVIRFIEEHAELGGRRLTPTEAAELIKKVAELYPTQPRRLDHVIWRHVSGREVFREEEVTSIVGEPAK
ncbi:hypothetical protein HAV21_03255 [Paenarthrobacter sp. MSM-2-10-13]|uniref:hypothetical protein n=1 Tax=Paenarthrobacter sp. MSM-2-10-13 TaxID=2717318 RepID=UPI001424204B|nr:hypothetical protein [Paenarthrobacter sp. MSM-2-10-13]NHW45915.1 hypothetical protein [Paenarthrobacter sp. MSM-2-10-13]